MNYEFDFKTEEEKNEIISDKIDLYLIKIHYKNGLSGTLTFSDTPTIEILQQEQGNKISILEAVNKQQDELTLDQEVRLAMLEFSAGSPVQ